MIFYHTNGGRLGNQIFQAAFVATLARPHERIYFTRMEHALAVISTARRGAYNFRGRIYKLFDRIVLPFIVPWLKRLRLITLVREVPLTDQVEIRRGLFDSVRWVEGYFQGEVFFDPKKIAGWRFDQTMQDVASKALKSLVPEGRVAVALHWRQGDYREFMVLGEKNPTLPLEYFQLAVEKMRQREPLAYFVIFSDESKKVASSLDLSPSDSAVSLYPPEIDLLMMKDCRHLILSNSSFSWWAGYWCKGQDKYVIAPKYWLGWKQKTPYPVAIEPSFAELLDVPTDAPASTLYARVEE